MEINAVVSSGVAVAYVRSACDRVSAGTGLREGVGMRSGREEQHSAAAALSHVQCDRDGLESCDTYFGSGWMMEAATQLPFALK